MSFSSKFLLALVTIISLLSTAAFPQTGRRRSPARSQQTLTARQIAQQVLPSVAYILMEGSRGKPACYGSGFFVRRDLILTNKHVITCSGTTRGRVNLVGNKQSFPITAVVAWPDLDVALIEAAGINAPPLLLDTSRKLAVGEDVFVAGNPEGLEGTFTRGIVSGIRSGEGLLQIDAPVSRGSSGGPVVDAYGKVVGITISSIREGQNLNFAIPAAALPTPLANMRQMIARQKRDRAATSDARSDPMGPAPSSPLPLNPARRKWEAGADWAQFLSTVVGEPVIRDELKALLDSGINVNAKDRSGRTALHYAAVLGQAELARHLLSRGANVNVKDARGRTPLMLAVGPGDLQTPSGTYAPLGDIWIGPLCEGGSEAQGSSASAIGWARWYTIIERRSPLIRLLLDSGADVGATDDKVRTAFDHAAAGGVTGIEPLLRGAAKSRGQSVCDLTVGRSPALRGLRLGMTTEEVSTRLRGLSLPSSDRCGLSYLAVAEKRLALLSREFEGLSLLRLAFVDGRLAYLHVAYQSEFPWKSFEAYLSTLSASLNLPNDWRRASVYRSLDNAHLISCHRVTAVAGYFKFPYVELHDAEALRTLVRRWDEAQRREQQKAEQEQERRRRSFKP
jgi:serine protease Do